MRASFHYVRPKLLCFYSCDFWKYLHFGALTGKEGPVHDVQWSFSGSEFAVVYGCILFFICYGDLSVRVNWGIVFINWHVNILLFLLRGYFASHLYVFLALLFFELSLSLSVTSVMPACVTIFDKKCKPLMELGEGPYNTLRWNPKGRGMILFFIPVFCCLLTFVSF